MACGEGLARNRTWGLGKTNEILPPLSLMPESFAPSAGPSDDPLSSVSCVFTVRMPERFRGGCAFGGKGHSPPALSRKDVVLCGIWR